MQTANSTDTIEIRGVVIPAQWDRRGNIIQVAVQTDSFEKYLVEGQKDAELMKRVDQTLSIRGKIIGEDVVGQKIILVSDYETLGMNEIG